MNSYEITFSLTSQEKIIVPLRDPLTLIGWNDEESILFSRNNHVITIADGPIYFDIRDLRDFLKKALNNELTLDPSITADIGYLFNEYNKNEEGFVIKRFENGLEAWVGFTYHLWFTNENNEAYITWIYNDNDRNIILKITPYYPYFNCDKKQEPDYVSYKQWIKNYQPYVIEKLPQETVQQWLEQAEYIVKTVDDNIVRWRKEEEQQNS